MPDAEAEHRARHGAGQEAGGGDDERREVEADAEDADLRTRRRSAAAPRRRRARRAAGRRCSSRPSGRHPRQHLHGVERAEVRRRGHRGHRAGELGAEALTVPIGCSAGRATRRPWAARRRSRSGRRRAASSVGRRPAAAAGSECRLGLDHPDLAAGVVARVDAHGGSSIRVTTAASPRRRGDVPITPSRSITGSLVRTPAPVPALIVTWLTHTPAAG